MRRPAAALLAVILASAASQGLAAGDGQSAAKGAQAPVEKTFLIPSGEGYGVGECLTGGASECGQVVANAWCEAQGYASAANYGVAAQDEYTGAIATAPVRPSERPIRITCQD
ncbi:hypothetical protein MMB17_03565 [Methylobacterium organophilum]|uniref:hypothetical protein n=1 Tax=Methylobacterium organophilum TaxID=410 RepID=UPI001F12AB5D|nr:hypothetical protein [Methylobacterium organophilum]UMY18430.1 hypothetical protein MMB17_03565 [Methylobacterium organophilum]